MLTLACYRPGEFIFIFFRLLLTEYDTELKMMIEKGFKSDNTEWQYILFNLTTSLGTCISYTSICPPLPHPAALSKFTPL